MSSESEIHINCDMGESFGRYTLVDDEMYMPFINACNIACGFHAGDPTVIEKTILNAKKYDLEIGAHPSFPDRQGFGRRQIIMDEKELESLIRYQVAALYGLTKSLGTKLSHVKVHGALYNLAAKNEATSIAVAKAVRSISDKLVLYAPYKSIQSSIAEELGVQVKYEAFIDRRYNNDRSLVSRKLENAVIQSPHEAWSQVYKIHREHTVSSIQDEEVTLEAQTFCIHGDNDAALEILKYFDSKINGKRMG